MRADRTHGAPPETAVDHLVVAAPTLAAGIDAIEQRLGRRPAAGGRHPAFGTHNALLSLGTDVYLEVIAPCPDLPSPPSGLPFGLAGLDRIRLSTWALRVHDGTSLDAVVARSGLDLGATLPGRRAAPDGSILTWTLTDPGTRLLDGVLPFLIQWGSTPHPAARCPSGGSLQDLVLEHPEAELVRDALRRLGAPTIPVHAAPAPGLVATIRCGARSVKLR